MVQEFLAGAACISHLIIAMFFLRFWQKTRDRLFLFFAGSFLIMMVERLIRAATFTENDAAPYVYSIRLAAFVVIIIGIVDKNRRT